MLTKALLTTIFYYVAGAVIYFGCAGRWDLPIPWVFFVCNFLVGVALMLILARKDPSLLKERIKPAPGDRDKLFRPVSTLFAVVQSVIAGLDAGRRHWPPVVSPALQTASLLLMLAGLLALSWALLTNAYFSIAVRLQPDRNQVVVASGPYQYVRHPGYAGGIPYFFFSGLALGSWWAALLAIPIIALTFRRILLEEAMLHKGLAGYTEYAARVRYRLIPGIW